MCVCGFWGVYNTPFWVFCAWCNQSNQVIVAKNKCANFYKLSLIHTEKIQPEAMLVYSTDQCQCKVSGREQNMFYDLI